MAVNQALHIFEGVIPLLQSVSHGRYDLLEHLLESGPVRGHSQFFRQLVAFQSHHLLRHFKERAHSTLLASFCSDPTLISAFATSGLSRSMPNTLVARVETTSSVLTVAIP